MHVWRDSGLLGDQFQPILRPMITIAEQVRLGDHLIGSDGQPTRVLNKSVPEWREFYCVKFDDGSHLNVSDDHLWTVLDLAKRAPEAKERGTYKTTCSTKTILDEGLRFHGQRRWAVQLISGPVDGPSAPAPIEPYTLGYWLGNGSSQGSTMTCHSADAAEIAQRLGKELGKELEYKIYDDTAQRATILIPGWIDKLICAGWPEQPDRLRRTFNKARIAVKWRTWSAADRSSLLAGLLDSDGHANTRGDIEFDSTDASFTYLVRGLMQSIGMKPTFPKAKKVRENEQTIYRISASGIINPFRLSRKADRVKTSGHKPRQSRRYIESIEPIGMMEGICFQVEANDSLYVAGLDYIVTHNTDALLIAPLRWVGQPDHHAIIFRKTYPETVDMIRKSRPIYLAHGGTWNASRKQWVFPSGARVSFGNLPGIAEAYKYQGEEYTWIGFDELCSWENDEAYEYLQSRLRRKQGSRCSLQVRASCNPIGPGKAWVQARFGIGPAGEDSRVVDGATGHGRRFIPARIHDNPKLRGSEYERILSGLPEAKRKALRDGRWDSMEGQFYPHLPVEEFRCMKHWRYAAGFDHGYAHNTAIVLGAQGDDGNYYIVDEHAKNKTAIKHHVEMFKERIALRATEMKNPKFSIKDLGFIAAGHDAFAKRTHEEGTIAASYAHCGFWLNKARIQRVAGWALLRELFGNPYDKDHPTEPRLIIHPRCVKLIAALRELRHDDHHPEDTAKMNLAPGKDDGVSDDLPDSVRYLIMSLVQGFARVGKTNF
jgi:hypothetical protein